MGDHPCRECAMRAKYEANPRSFFARIWRWHLKICPGWKSFMKSLPPEERSELQKKYGLVKGG